MLNFAGCEKLCESGRLLECAGNSSDAAFLLFRLYGYYHGYQESNAD